MVKPITPSKAALNKQSAIPDFVIEAFNTLIAQNYDTDSESATVLQKDAIKEIMKADSTLTKSQIFDRGYLDIEPIFKKAGWEVEYDKPGYNEDYEAFFTFGKRE